METAAGVTERCWLCAGPTAPAPGYVNVGLVQCRDCGFVLQPDPDVDALRANHSDEYFEHYSGQASYDDEPQRRLEARKRLTWMARHGVRGGRLLDVGTASGYFLDEARRAGYSVAGLEGDEHAATRAHARFGVDVTAAWVEEADLETGGFDVICLWHVLEHVPRPLRMLDRLRDALRPDGMLFCEVPNIVSVAAQSEFEAWGPLDPDHHVGFFSPDTVATALRRANFAVVATDSIPMLHYTRLSARPLTSNVRRQLTLMLRGRAPLAAAHPWKHELLRAAATVR
jgi:2-polyprenyl-3-methyl-5-hydroxy-6-metoxy-1,4-benzoquinol methylase